MGAGELIGLAAALALLGGGLALGLMRASDRPQPSPPSRAVDGPHVVGADDWTWTADHLHPCTATSFGGGSAWCTREKSHPGCHVAGDSETIVAVWRQGACTQCDPKPRGWWEL